MKFLGKTYLAVILSFGGSEALIAQQDVTDKFWDALNSIVNKTVDIIDKSSALMNEERIQKKTAEPKNATIEKKNVLAGNSLRLERKLEFPMQGTFYLTSLYGKRIHPIYKDIRFHKGIDIRCKQGTSVRAVENGVVIFSGWKSGYGYFIKIKHANGLVTGYGHLKKYVVFKGQRVSQNDLIAYSGNTGNSTGPHLHFEVSVSGTSIDPLKVLNVKIN